MSRVKQKILLVDDEKTDVEAMCRAFNGYSKKYSILVASNLFEAKAQFSENIPDLVIVDLFLPDGSGMELLPSEKNDFLCPFIILSGKGNEEKAVDAMKKGALNYLVKNSKTLSLIPVFVEIAIQEWEVLQEKKQAQREMIKAKEEAEKANLAKSEFLSRASHELRTPMNSILGFGQLLKMDVVDPLKGNQIKNVEYILKAGNHLLLLINDLLDLSKIESGEMAFSFVNIDIKSFIDELIVIVKPLAEKKKIEFYNRLPLDSEIFVSADIVRLRQVLLNLISNAIKYNCVNGKVIFECEKVSSSVFHIKVIDTGVGISKDNFDDIFNSFYRLEKDSSSVEGTGIGLNVAKGLIELMGGSIKVESVLGEGSCFTLELPASKNLEES